MNSSLIYESTTDIPTRPLGTGKSRDKTNVRDRELNPSVQLYDLQHQSTIKREHCSLDAQQHHQANQVNSAPPGTGAAKPTGPAGLDTMLSAMLRWLRKTGEDRSQPATDHAFFFRSSLPPTGGSHGQPYGQGQALSLARVPGEPRPLHTAPRPLGGDSPVAITPCGWPWGPTHGSGKPLAPARELGRFGLHSYVVTRSGNLLTPLLTEGRVTVFSIHNPLPKILITYLR